MNTLIKDCSDFFVGCDFPYAICGGYALDMFLGKDTRPHVDIDLSVFDTDRAKVAEWFLNKGWKIYFRPVRKVNHLERISCSDNGRLLDANYIYAVKSHSPYYRIFPKNSDNGGFRYEINGCQTEFDFADIRFNDKDDQHFICGSNKAIKRELNKAILLKDTVPFLSPEVVLFFKSETYLEPYYREKSLLDFFATIPSLAKDSTQWLISAIEKANVDEHSWAEILRRV